MFHCNNCLENIWEFEKLPDGYIRATCQMCGNEVEWKPQKKKPKPKDKCKCGNKLVLVDAKITDKKLRKAYYYLAYHKCFKCRRIYYSEKFKVYNKTNI